MKKDIQKTKSEDLKEVYVLDGNELKKGLIEINYRNIELIDDFLGEINRLQENLSFYPEIIHSIVKTGDIEKIRKISTSINKEQIRNKKLLDLTKEQYEKLVNSCDHSLKVNFGGGYQKCLICEAENDACLTKIFFKRKSNTIYVEDYIKKFGKCFECQAQNEAFYQIKNKFFELLYEYEQNGEEVDMEKIKYELAIFTHGYTNPVKKIGSFKVSL